MQNTHAIDLDSLCGGVGKLGPDRLPVVRAKHSARNTQSPFDLGAVFGGYAPLNPVTESLGADFKERRRSGEALFVYSLFEGLHEPNYTRCELISQQLVKLNIHEVFNLGAMQNDERPIDRLLRMAKENGMNQNDLGDMLGASPAQLSNWKTRGMPPAWHAKAAEVVGVTVEELLNGGPRTEPSANGINLGDHPDLVTIRRVHLRLQAGVNGFAIEGDEAAGEPIFFRADWLQMRGFKPYNLLALKVAGQSMEPNLYPDDMVVVNTADREPRDGKVFAVNYEGEAVIKRMVRDQGAWWLSSDNPDQRRFPRKECTEGSCIIVGQVIHKQSEQI